VRVKVQEGNPGQLEDGKTSSDRNHVASGASFCRKSRKTDDHPLGSK